VDEGDFRLQMDGIAAAVRNPQLLDAITTGRHRAIALTLLQWSSAKSQEVTIGWRVLVQASDLEAFARQAENAKRKWLPGGTGLAAAIVYSVALLETAPVVAMRRVIDVSGDGEDNDGGSAAQARDEAVARGITVNGLPIISGSRRLETYYRTQVIGGDDAFLVPAGNMMAFEDAMTKKLLREVGVWTS
jgi:hypothetical protein